MVGRGVVDAIVGARVGAGVGASEGLPVSDVMSVCVLTAHMLELLYEPTLPPELIFKTKACHAASESIVLEPLGVIKTRVSTSMLDEFAP